MKYNYNTVIFDLDGTLLNTLEDLTDCVNHTMKVFGYKERTIEEVRRFVGNGIGMLVKRAVPDYVTDEQYEKVFAEYKMYYTENCQVKTKPYDGVLELVNKLHNMGIKLAIVTNKNQKAVNELNKKYFGGIINVAVGDNGVRERKPSTEPIAEALKILDSRAEDTIYVGDSEVDIATAENSGLYDICVTWGFRDKKQLVAAGGQHFIDKPNELLKYF